MERLSAIKICSVSFQRANNDAWEVKRKATNSQIGVLYHLYLTRQSSVVTIQAHLLDVSSTTTGIKLYTGMTQNIRSEYLR